MKKFIIAMIASLALSAVAFANDHQEAAPAADAAATTEAHGAKAEKTAKKAKKPAAKHGEKTEGAHHE